MTNPDPQRLIGEMQERNATLKAEVARLRDCILAIQMATIDGRVCDDVAWFGAGETLHDFCDRSLNQQKSE